MSARSLPELLRAVERGVGALEEARRRVAVEELGDAAREPETLLVRAESGSAHRVVHAAKELLAVVGGGLRHDHRELVAADTGGDVDRPHRFAEPVGRLGEHAIAGEVADLVVDRLEVVEVEDDERELPLVAVGSHHLAAQRLLEVALVEEARERIRLGELARLAVAAGVLDRRDAARGKVLGLLDLLRPRLVIGARQKSESVPTGRSSRPMSGMNAPPRMRSASTPSRSRP